MSFAVKISSGRYYEWHVPSSKPAVDRDRIEVLQADGDELEFIRKRLPNLPITLGGVCKWRGEMAQFIYENIH